MEEPCKIRECVGAARRRHRQFIPFWCCLIPLSLLTVSVSNFPVTAQVSVDETLGNETSVVVSNQTVRGEAAILIEGGASRGANLFHSFREFNVGDGQRIYFANPTGIQNILSRVTGNTPSNILGTLGVNGSANLFLINPNGIIFGPNAQLDVSGSLLVTTANAMQFGNQGFFNVSDPQVPPLLTINPSALWFNQTATQPVIRSTANTVGLQTAPRQSLLLVGGVVQLDGGKIFAPGGRVELGSVGGQETVGLQFENNQWRLAFADDIERTDISVTNDAQVNVRGDGGGDIRINARNFTMTGENTALLAGIDGGFGDRNTQAGNIEINATEAVKLDASLIDNSILENAIANGGKIQIQTGLLSLTNGAQLNSDLFGEGNLGDLTVDAKSVLIDERGSRGSSGLVSNVRNTNSEGNNSSSNITITTESLTVSNGGRILTATRGRGNAGNLTINASDTVSFLGFSQVNRTTSGAFSAVVNNTAVGNAGNLTINTGSLLLNRGASLRTLTEGKGDAGDITINARDRVEFDGIKPPPGASIGGILSFARDGAVGDGGDIAIATGSLFVKNGAQISAESTGQGNAGNITIIARETAAWDGITINGFFSGATTSVERLFFPEQGLIGNAAGNGGTITVTAKNVSLTNGAEFNTRIYDAPGKAGSIIINANTLTLSNAKLIAETTSGKGGDINLQVRNILLLRRNTLITATAGITQVGGDGGNITINAPFILGLSNENSDIIANAFNGQGGRVDITAKNIFGFTVRSREDLQKLLNSQALDPNLLPTSDISAISQTNPTLNGIVNINALNVNPTQGVTELPTDLVDVTQQINQQLCNITQKSSFIITGRGGLPETPSATLKPDVTWEDWRVLADESPMGNDVDKADLPMEPIIEAQDWLVDAKGIVHLTAKPISSQLRGCKKRS